jgi:hypothetical protein
MGLFWVLPADQDRQGRSRACFTAALGHASGSDAASCAAEGESACILGVPRHRGQGNGCRQQADSGYGDLGGGFSQSGAITVSSGLQETYPQHTGNQSRIYRTDWVYERYSQCNRIFVQPKEWAGGKITKNVGALKNASKCVPELPGQSEVISGTAATFEGGVSIGKDIGIDLTAQTDYSATAAIFFQLHGHGHAHLCGTTDFPGGANPGFVEQKK